MLSSVCLGVYVGGFIAVAKHIVILFSSGVTIISGPPGKYSLWAPSKFDSQIW